MRIQRRVEASFYGEVGAERLISPCEELPVLLIRVRAIPRYRDAADSKNFLSSPNI